MGMLQGVPSTSLSSSDRPARTSTQIDARSGNGMGSAAEEASARSVRQTCILVVDRYPSHRSRFACSDPEPVVWTQVRQWRARTQEVGGRGDVGFGGVGVVRGPARSCPRGTRWVHLDSPSVV